MSDEHAPPGSRRTLQPEVQVLVSMFAACVLMAIVTLVVIAVLGLPPARLRLAGPTWQWTGSTVDSGGIPLAAADPGAYAIRFAPDGTFAATADCNRVSGTYEVVPAGRAGGALSHISLVPGPATLASCGPASLSAEFLRQLGSARRYAIDGTRLTLELAPSGAMTFEGAGPPAD